MRNLSRGLIVALFVLIPLTARAQSSIAGFVKDTSGAILPGVTVEASSDALIEKTPLCGDRQRRPVSASSICRPGTYSVVFSLSGFKTVRREGIVLQGTFTAQVNGELQVGALEETITVTGESPDRRRDQQHRRSSSSTATSSTRFRRRSATRRRARCCSPARTVTPFVLGQYTMSVHGSASPTRSSRSTACA